MTDKKIVHASRVLHPYELDTGVIIADKALQRNFPTLDMTVESPTRRTIIYIASWRWCPEKYYHEYTGMISVDPNSDLFTEEEKAYGYKELSFTQEEIMGVIK